MPTTTYLNLMGGLGNQLFQIFALINYSIENNTQFKINKIKEDMVSPCDGKSPRPVYWETIFINLYKYTYENNNLYVNVYDEPGFSYNKIPYYDNDILIKGFFQSEKYFKANYKQILLDILNIHEIKKSIIYYPHDNKTTVSIHFRIGDYITGKHYGNILELPYYISSLNYIKEHCKEPIRVLYFKEESDNVDIMMNELQNMFPDIEFVQSEGSDWEQLLQMSLCKHNIIANSSFSWWGAYLNENENKMVCYPNTWFDEKYSFLNTTDLIPEKWIKIK